MGRHRIDVRQRLEQYRRIDPVTGCWIWTKSCGEKGYGQIWIVDKFVRVSRAAYEIFIGPIPEGLNVCHICDNPPCFNPAHLFAGTQKQNISDMMAKGRGWMQGLRCPNGHVKEKHGRCMQCARDAALRAYYKHRDKHRERRRQYYWRNPEQAREKSRTYYHEHNH